MTSRDDEPNPDDPLGILKADLDAEVDARHRTETDELTKGQRICRERGFHEDEEFIDPQSGGFTRCKTCGRDVDREESEEW